MKQLLCFRHWTEAVQTCDKGRNTANEANPTITSFLSRHFPVTGQVGRTKQSTADSLRRQRSVFDWIETIGIGGEEYLEEGALQKKAFRKRHMNTNLDLS